ncbi:hypothetical protein HMPREF9536_03339 [Escherichia coli MS 84-1]|nr:hypothetical protein HMPREF9536_03339 [Escherichia coli MS 84-1]
MAKHLISSHESPVTRFIFAGSSPHSSMGYIDMISVAHQAALRLSSVSD